VKNPRPVMHRPGARLFFLGCGEDVPATGVQGWGLEESPSRETNILHPRACYAAFPSSMVTSVESVKYLLKPGSDRQPTRAFNANFGARFFSQDCKTGTGFQRHDVHAAGTGPHGRRFVPLCTLNT
jgi:hypothetical protein